MKNLTSLAHVGSDGSGIPWDLNPDPNRSDYAGAGGGIPVSEPEPDGSLNQVKF